MLTGVIVAMILEIGTMLAWGRLSDRIGRKPVYMIGAVCLVLIAFPFFWLIDTHWTPLDLARSAAGYRGLSRRDDRHAAALMGELFSTEVRYSGMALGHEIASVFAGGLSPLIATALLAHYHAVWPVALLLIGMGMITVVSLLFTHETVACNAPSSHRCNRIRVASVHANALAHPYRISETRDQPPDHDTGIRQALYYEWYVVAICMLAYIFSFIDRQVLALMIEPIKRICI